MAKKDDLNQANSGAPAADIPDLKKKDKERKKAGAAWSGAKPGAGSFSGATGGTVARAAASAAGAAGEAGAAAAAEAAGLGAGGFFGSISSFLSGLAATLVGKMAIAAAAILLLAGGAMIAAGLLKGGGAAGDGVMGDLGALSSSMKVRMGGNDRTGYVASNGEIAFDPVNGGAAKPAEKAAAPTDAAPAGDPANPLTPQPEENKDAGFNRPGLDHNLSGSKLSSSLGGGFGNKNIFSGNNASNKLGDAMGKFNIKGGEKGRMSATRAASRTGKVAAGTSTRGMKANKAFGQLKVARGASMIGAGASGAEAAKNAAANAFDGGNLGGSTVGGTPPGAAPTGNVDTPSTPGGAPDLTGGPSAPTGNIQDVGAATAAALAAIGQLISAAMKMKMMGTMLVAVGLALVLAGCTIWTHWLIPIGLAIAAMGYMMIQQSDKLMAQAAEMSKALAERTTDQRQNAINNYCIEKAKGGTPPANCNPPDDLTGKDNFKKATEHGKTNNERILREDGRVEGDNGKAL